MKKQFSLEVRSTPPERPTITAPDAARRLGIDHRTMRRNLEIGTYAGGWYVIEGGQQRNWFVYSDVPPFAPLSGTSAPATPNQDTPTAAPEMVLSAALEFIAELRERDARRDEQLSRLIAQIQADQAAIRADQMDYESRMNLMAAASSESGLAAAEILASAQRLQRALEMTNQIVSQIHLPKFGPDDSNAVL
jgi:hypothetical protein